MLLRGLDAELRGREEGVSLGAVSVRFGHSRGKVSGVRAEWQAKGAPGASLVVQVTLREDADAVLRATRGVPPPIARQHPRFRDPKRNPR